MKVMILGDTHGKEHWILSAILDARLYGLDTIIQVGDLGIWPGAEAAAMWDRIEDHLTRCDITIYCAPGNHEDYDQIDALTPRADGWLPYREHILLAPRGHRSTLGGRTIVWLGGAGSIDRTARLRQGGAQHPRTWWPQEFITEEDMEHTIAGGRADIMICHDAPEGLRAVEALDATAINRGIRPMDLQLAHQSRAHLTQAVRAVQPRLLIHGHFHFAISDQVDTGAEHPTRVVGLAHEGAWHWLGGLDLGNLEIEWPDG